MFVITYSYITYELSSAVLWPELTHLPPVHHRSLPSRSKAGKRIYLRDRRCCGCASDMVLKIWMDPSRWGSRRQGQLSRRLTVHSWKPCAPLSPLPVRGWNLDGVGALPSASHYGYSCALWRELLRCRHRMEIATLLGKVFFCVQSKQRCLRDLCPRASERILTALVQLVLLHYCH